VLSARTNGAEPAPASALEAGVHRVTPLRTPLDWWEARQATRAWGGASMPVLDAEAVPAKPATAFKRLALGAFWIPDPQLGFAWRAADAAMRLSRSRPFDLVYTTAPPFSSHVAGLYLTQRLRVPWIMECRDPWTDVDRKPINARHVLTDWLDARLERACFAAAARVVVVSETYRSVLARRDVPGLREKLLLSRNGIPRILAAASSVRPEKLIVYAGTMYRGRDPRAFFAALATVMNRHQLGGNDVKVKLVGDCREFLGQSVVAMARAAGLSDVVEFVDWIPHSDAQALFREADLLLLFAQNQGLCIPNKVYEYLGAQRPILAIAERDGETAQVLGEVGGHFAVEPDDSDGLERALEAALGLAHPPWRFEPPNEAALGALTTEAQLGSLVRTLTDSTTRWRGDKHP